VAGGDLPRLAGHRVLRRLRRREVVERRLHPAGERRRVQLSAELAQIVVALRDLPEEEVAVGPNAGAGVRAKAGHPLGPRLDHVGEGVLAGCPLLDRQAPPGRIDTVERIGDVLALHCPNASHRRTSGGLASALGAPRFTGADSRTVKRYRPGAIARVGNLT